MSDVSDGLRSAAAQREEKLWEGRALQASAAGERENSALRFHDI